MKTLQRNIIVTVAVLLAIFGLSACTWDGYSDSHYCNDVQITLKNLTRSPIYFSWDSKYCDQVLYPRESTTFSFGSENIDLSRPRVIYLDYDYVPGYTHAPSLAVEIDDCYKEVYLQ